MTSVAILSRPSTFSSFAVTSDSSTITYDHQQGVGRTVYGLMRSAGDRVEVLAGILSTWRRQGKHTGASNFNVHVLKRNQLGYTRHGGFVCSDNEEGQSFTVFGGESYAVFKGRVAQFYGLAPDSFRLLMLVKHRNRVNFLHPTADSFTLADLAERDQSDSTITRFYLQNIPQLPQPAINFPHVLVFIGQYDANKPWEKQQNLSDFWQLYVPRSSTAEDTIAIFRRRIDVQKNDDVNLYVVGEDGFYDMLPPRYLPVSGESCFYDGDVLWYEVVSRPKSFDFKAPLSSKRPRLRSITNNDNARRPGVRAPPSPSHPNTNINIVRPPGVRTLSGTRRIPVVITFTPKLDLECPVFRLVFDLRDTYDDIADKVSDHLSLYPSSLTPHFMVASPHSIALEWRDNLQIRQILNLQGVEAHNQTFEYELLQEQDPWVQEVQKVIRQAEGMEEQQRQESETVGSKFMWPTKERMARARLFLGLGEMLDILDAAGLSH
ncbi:hypothetical protein DL96DRAFT_1615198 [Flagelloscypha sp. PMI_526]|nr:hypothetical protein DL96DRAFT_1615198 [Flagelloscypha sp. PMI_526]